MRFTAVALGMLLLVGGCTSTPPPTPAVSSAPMWSEPQSYSFTLERHCNRGPAMGLYAVTVTGGEVVKADRIGAAASGEEEIDVPSLGDLVEMAETASEDGAEVTAKYDPADGHPLEVTINADAEAVDGASCFTVTNYQPA